MWLSHRTVASDEDHGGAGDGKCVSGTWLLIRFSLILRRCLSSTKSVYISKLTSLNRTCHI
jgi:hypothetical protein